MTDPRAIVFRMHPGNEPMFAARSVPPVWGLCVGGELIVTSTDNAFVCRLGWRLGWARTVAQALEAA